MTSEPEGDEDTDLSQTDEQVWLVALGQRIRTRRRALNLTQADLARRARFDRSGIAELEEGGRNLRLSSLRRLAEALKMHPADLLEDRPGRRKSN
ncbi:helix-turn-helix domain-containing protein [Amycolatopsis pithecellobii]|uniref:Helix-turn-helix domain-containing protein n=1 Tax=Amycolatopsis pithecellobii TaxID=664692 RepID=A0A6N7Z7H8_9PSEU|nr:helix-turn-helix transcriptional regulator [Amycolatopsis pithecellobii]MTD57154.1 helix-turn-helix domain-containing protein [Amycolatopsis pithecellobii]